jgi:hypothetical protein
MGNALRHRWIIRYVIATRSRSTLPLLAKNPLLGDAGQLPTQVGQFLITWAAIAHKRLIRFLAQLPPPASQDIRLNPQFCGNLVNAHTWGLQHRHRFALVLR